VAEPAPDPAEDVPALDESLVERAYRLERAKRRARSERERARRGAGLRFWLALALLLTLATVLAVTAWREIQTLFGL
jgi:hypothetical protein